jgi:hypothetical protein
MNGKEKEEELFPFSLGLRPSPVINRSQMRVKTTSPL